VSGDRTLVLAAAAIGTPWLAAVAVVAVRRYTRAIGFSAVLAAVAASGLLLEAHPRATRSARRSCFCFPASRWEPPWCCRGATAVRGS